MRHLTAAFHNAREWEYNPSCHIKSAYVVKEDREFPRFLTRQEIVRLLGAIDDPRFRLCVEFALYSGLRRSEIVQLTWAHVDPRGFILVPLGKSRRERYLPISERLRDVLERLKALGLPGPKLFPWGKDAISHKFKKYAKKAGLSDVRFHDLRHTFASHLVMSGVDIRTVQKLMGHSDIKATLVYAHLSPDHLTAAMDQLNFGTHLQVVNNGSACNSLAEGRKGQKKRGK